MGNSPRVYALLTHELARKGTSPAGFYPKAHVFMDDGGTITVQPLEPQSVHLAASRAEADRIMLPVLRAWLRSKGWEDAEIYAPRPPD